MPTNYSGTDTFPATFQVPSDGDPRAAASVNVGLEALGDRTTWLKNRATGQFSVGVYQYVFGTTATAPGVDNFSGFTSTSWTKPGSGGLVDIPACNSGDILLIDCTYGWEQTLLGSSELRLYFIWDQTGTPVELSGGIPGSRSFHFSVNTLNSRAAIAVAYSIPNAGTNKTARVGIEAIVASGKNLDILSSLVIRVHQLRNV